MVTFNFTDDQLKRLPVQPEKEIEQNQPDMNQWGLTTEEGFQNLQEFKKEPNLEDLYIHSLPLNPDQEAKIKNAEQILGYPSNPFIRNNIEITDKALKGPGKDFFYKLEREEPKTYKWLRTQNKLPYTYDDLDALPWYERLVKTFETGWKNTLIQSNKARFANEDVQNMIRTGSLSSKNEKMIKILDKGIQDLPLRPEEFRDSFFRKYLYSPAYYGGGLTRNIFDTTVQGGGYFGSSRAFMGNAAIFIIESASMAATALYGPAAGTAVKIAGNIPFVMGSTEEIKSIESGSAYLEYRALKDDFGKSIDPIKAAKMANAVGGIVAGSELIGQALVFRGAVLGKKTVVPIIRAIGKKLLKQGVSDLSEKALQKTILQMAKETAGKGIKQIAEIALIEPGTESIQRGITVLGEEKLKQEAGSFSTQMRTQAQVLQEMKNEYIPALQGTAFLFGLGGLARGAPKAPKGFFYVKNNFINRKMADETQAFLKATQKASSVSKTNQRTPEVFEDYANETLDGTGLENVYIPLQDIESLAQEIKDPELSALLPEEKTQKLITLLGANESYEESKGKAEGGGTGGDIVISTARLNALASRNDAYAVMNDYAKFHPGHASVSELNREKTTVEQEEQQKQEDYVMESKTENPEMFNSLQKQYEKVLSDSGKPLNMSEQEFKSSAKNWASIWAARDLTESQKRGQTLEDFKKGQKPIVVVGTKNLKYAIDKTLKNIQERKRTEKRLSDLMDKYKDNRLVIAAVRDGEGMADLYQKKQEIPAATMKDISSALSRLNINSEFKDFRTAALQIPETSPVPQLYSKIAKTILETFPDEISVKESKSRIQTIGKESELNFTEILSNIPEKGKISKKELLTLLQESQLNITDIIKIGPQTKFDSYTLPGEKTQYTEVLFKINNLKETIEQKEQHRYPKQNENENILAFTRFDTRKGPNGEKILFIEEIQSDLFSALKNQEKAIGKNAFSKEYLDYVLKRLMLYAAKNSYDQIGWTTAQQQKERYPLTERPKKITITRQKDGSITADVWFVGDGSLYQQFTYKTDEALREGMGPLYSDNILNALEGKDSATLKGDEIGTGSKIYTKIYEELIPRGLKKIGKQYGISIKQEPISISSSRTEDIFVVDLNDEMKQGIVESGLTLFQEEPFVRGITSLTENQQVITLMKRANASTFLHEISHVWLEDVFQYTQTTQLKGQYQQDWNTLKEWLDISDAQKKLTKEQQEKFATGFEDYLYTGKAPSNGLRKAFRELKKWLMRAYYAFIRKGDKISKGIHDVFSRMLLSETMMEEAEKELGYDLEVLDLESLSPEERQEIESLRSDTMEIAREYFLAQLMEDVSKERIAFLRSEKLKATQEAMRDIQNIPVIKAEELIQTTMGLSSEEAVQKYQDESLSDEQLFQFLSISNQLSFESPEALIAELNGMATKESMIQQKVDAYMAQYDTFLTEESIQDEALHYAHNPKRSDLMVLDMILIDYLRQKSYGKSLNFGSKEKLRTLYNSYKVKLENDSKLEIYKKNYKELRKYTVYYTQERNAAVKVAENLGRKNYDEALKYKKEQIKNHTMAIEARKAFKDLQKKEIALKKWQHLSKKKILQRFKIPEWGEFHFEVINKLLWGLGFENKSVPITNKVSLQQWKETFNTPETGNEANIRDTITPDALAQSGGFYAISYDDAVESYHAIQNIYKIARTQFELIKGEKTHQLEELLVEAEKQIAERPKSKKAIYPRSMEEIESDRGRPKSWQQYNLAFMNLDSAIGILDGNKDSGFFRTWIYEPMIASASKFYNYLDRYTAILNQAKDSLYKDDSVYFEQLDSQLVYIQEFGDNLRRTHLMMILLNMGNPSNKSRLLGSVPEFVKLEYAENWNEEILISVIEKNLKKKDVLYVQKMWDVYEDYWDDIKTLNKKMTGFVPNDVQKESVVLKIEGETVILSGGYHALKADKQQVMKDMDLLQLNKIPNYYRTNTSHVNNRSETAKYPVYLNIEAFHKALYEQLFDLAFRETLSNLNKLINNTTLQNLIKQNFGIQLLRKIQDHMEVMFSTRSPQIPGIFDMTVSWLSTQVGRFFMALNPAIIFQNLANILSYGNIIEGYKAKNITNATVKILLSLSHDPATRANNKKMIQQINALSPFMRRRFQSSRSQYEINRKQTGIKKRWVPFKKVFSAPMINQLVKETNTSVVVLQNWYETFEDASETLLNIFDKKMAYIHWQEAYTSEIDSLSEKIKANVLTPEEANEKAVIYADTLIKRVISSYETVDRPTLKEFSESKSIRKLFLQFTSFYITQLQNAMRSIRSGDPVRMIFFFLNNYIVYSLVSNIFSFLYAGKDEGEEEENILYRWAIRLLHSSMSYTASTFPLIGVAAMTALSATFGKKGRIAQTNIFPSGRQFSGQGSLLRSPSIQALDQIYNGTLKMKTAEDAAKAGALITGIPQYPLKLFFNSVDILEGNMEFEPADLVKRRPKRERR